MVGQTVTAAPSLDVAAVWRALGEVMDPEIPVVSVVDLGIVQAVRVTAAPDGRARVEVDLTPTFSGCPALDLMRREIQEAVTAAGAAEVEVRLVMSPPWTSDRISEDARERMRLIGISPPGPRPAESLIALDGLTLSLPADGPRFGRHGTEESIACPFCGSANTTLENAFGPTICRELHYCRLCRQPFERFKAL